MTEVCMKMDFRPDQCKTVGSSTNNVYDKKLKAEKELFLITWYNHFPGEDVPQVEFSARTDAESYLSAVTLLINFHEKKLKQKKLYKRFLEVLCLLLYVIVYEV